VRQALKFLQKTLQKMHFKSMLSVVAKTIESASFRIKTSVARTAGVIFFIA
jgi:hypothetical protein